MCGNLCSATAVQHGQLSGRIFSIRHVRSNSGERVSVGPSVSSLGLNVVAWALRRHVPHSIFDGWESMCSAPKAVYTGCEVVWGGGVIALLTHRSPLNTKGDYATDRKIRNLGVGRAVVRISDVDIQWGGEPVLVRSPPDKRAVRPRSDLMGATWRPTLAT